MARTSTHSTSPVTPKFSDHSINLIPGSGNCPRVVQVIASRRGSPRAYDERLRESVLRHPCVESGVILQAAIAVDDGEIALPARYSIICLVPVVPRFEGFRRVARRGVDRVRAVLGPRVFLVRDEIG